MNKILRLYKKKDKILDFLFYLLATFTLLDYGISSLLISLLLLLNLIVNGIKVSLIWFFGLYFIYLLLISIYFSGFEDSVSRLSSSFLLFFIPVFLSSFKIDMKKLKNFAKIYVFSILLKSLICLLLLFFDKKFIQGGSIPLLNVDVHGTFFSYEIMIAILLVYHLIQNKYKIIALVFLSLIIILFQKKIALFILALFWVFHMRKNKQYLTLTIISLGTLFVFYKTSYLEKIRLLINTSLNFNLVGEDRVRIRLFKAGWQNFMEAPILGKGAVKHTLFYSEYNLTNLGAWAQNYNTHNYFLFVLCSGGILAFLFFLSPYAYFIIKTFKKSKPFFIFLIITLIFNLTESLLDRYNGVITFSIFCLFFYEHYLKKENHKI
tara:strand:- start:5571 stop:6704 length:1134 start_codon:yes stop_codon:yes gene_type:complete